MAGTRVRGGAAATLNAGASWRNFAAIALSAAVLLCAAAIAIAAPLPDPVPREWEFRFEPGSLRTAVVDTEEAGPRAFYFLTYYVENNTGADRYFAPRFELVTDTGQVLRSGRDVPREATREIMRRIQNPLLRDEIRVQGPLLQGEQNAREGLVVWPASQIDVDDVTVYAAGFSGENVIVRRPDTGDTVVLRKTKMLRHTVPGELQPRRESPLERTIERWIMR